MPLGIKKINFIRISTRTTYGCHYKVMTKKCPATPGSKRFFPLFISSRSLTRTVYRYIKSSSAAARREGIVWWYFEEKVPAHAEMASKTIAHINSAFPISSEDTTVYRFCHLLASSLAQNYQINLKLCYCGRGSILLFLEYIYVFLNTRNHLFQTFVYFGIVSFASEMIERNANFGESDNKCVEALR